MMQRTLFAILLAGAMMLIPASALAIPIHHHLTVTKHKRIRMPETGQPEVISYKEQVVRVEHVAPPYVPPAPTPAPQSVSVAQPTPTTTSVPAPAATTSGGCPSYMAAEASSPSAVNPSSGASGCFQILPSTAASLGCTDVGVSCAQRICATAGNAAWAASGATPCNYIGSKP